MKFYHLFNAVMKADHARYRAIIRIDVFIALLIGPVGGVTSGAERVSDPHLEVYEIKTPKYPTFMPSN
jgi:hypothetical protein